MERLFPGHQVSEAVHHQIVRHSHRSGDRHAVIADRDETLRGKDPGCEAGAAAEGHIGEHGHRDLGSALEHQKQLLDELILVEGGNFDSVKIHMLDLYLSLTHIATESGVPLRKVFGGNLGLLTPFSNVENVETLNEWAHHAAELFANEVFAGLSPLSSTTAKAVSYLSEHYMDKITLRDLAGKLFVSDSYLSKLFRQELGTSFTDYLNKSRVEHSIDLMQGTELSLLEISGMVGFEDQSYFTKVFKRITGETPRQYKSHLLNSKGAEES